MFVSLFHILAVSFVVLPFTNKYIYNFNSIFNHILFFLPSSLFSDKIYCQHIVILCCCIILFFLSSFLYFSVLSLFIYIIIILWYFETVFSAYMYNTCVHGLLRYSCFIFFVISHELLLYAIINYDTFFFSKKKRKNAKLCCCRFFMFIKWCGSVFFFIFPLQLFVFYVFQLIDTTSSQYSVVFMRIGSSF